jgi:PilZ domain-containing protein
MVQSSAETSDYRHGELSFQAMSDTKPSPAQGADWTQLLTDPDLVSHLGKLLQTYRDAPADKRDQALLEALREIKGNKATMSAAAGASSCTTSTVPETPKPITTSPAATPPFEPDIFTPSWGEDRRRFPRMKCFVAVEVRLDGAATPVWGNLSNTSMGGCFVETASPVPTGVSVEVGLWVASGKIWVKGMILNGIVTKSSPCFGVRIRFGQMQPNERESLREFLKFVESTTRGYSTEHGYLAQMKK